MMVRTWWRTNTARAAVLTLVLLLAAAAARGETARTVWAWGNNSAGQLGDNSTTDRHEPGQVPRVSDAVAVAAGGGHSLALASNGRVWAWGHNTYGQLGDGSTTGRLEAGQVAGLTGVVAIAAGHFHSLALQGDGSVWGWGWNSQGQLGTGSTSDRHAPTQVPGLSDVAAIAAGTYHSLAVAQDGSVWAWGANWNGQLGDGSKTRRTAPVRVHTLTHVVAVAAGDRHSLALKNDGTVWAWGKNSAGQLGDDSTADRLEPVQVGGVAGAVAIAAGYWHSLAVHANGTAFAWGSNKYGALGDGSTTDRLAPVQIRGPTGAVAVAGGGYYSLVARSDGTVWASGRNDAGQLGDDSTTDRLAPVQARALTSAAVAAAGHNHSLALLGSPGAAPGAPVVVWASDGAYSDKVRVAWSLAPGALTYQVWRNTANDSAAAAQVASAVPATSYDDATAAVGVPYWYWVKAARASGVSGFSGSDPGYRAGAAPPPPATVSASDGTHADKVEVIWSAVADATAYEVWRHSSSTSGSAVRIAASLTDTTHDDTTAAVGITYWYWIKARNEHGDSGFSAAEAGYRAGTPPPAPTGLAATDDVYPDRVRVTWTAAAGATSYAVWRHTAADSSAAVQIAASIAGLSYDDTTAAPDTTHWYWAKAANDQGTSDFSTSDSGRWTAKSPSAPTGVAASDGTYPDRVRVAWTAAPGATSYDVWRHTANDAGAAVRIVESSVGTAHDDTAAVAGTTYWYWVTATNAGGTSGLSDSDSGYWGGAVPPPPTGVAATDGTHADRVAVTWAASPGATSYAVWRHTADDPGGAARLAASVASTSYDDATASAGTTYWYWVTATSADGTSGFSTSDSGHRGGTPAVAIAPSGPVDFGTVALGQSKELDAFTVTNPTGGTLVANVWVPPPFAVVEGANLSLGLGQKQTVRIRFTPPAAGRHTATVSLATNAGPATVTATGACGPAPVAAAGPELSAEVGTTVALDGGGSRAGEETNVALASNGATITGTNGTNWATLIDGNSEVYTGGTGFGYTFWTSKPRGSMTITLAQVSVIHRIRVKLWDLDGRFYRYRVEAATSPGGPWQTVMDRTSDTHQGWCEDDFATPIEAQYLRVTGTYNSSNSGFHVVEFEAYAGKLLKYEWTLDSAPQGSQAGLGDHTVGAPTFVPDFPGDYVFKLEVDDGVQWSLPDWATVTAVMPPRPLADAGPHQTAEVGETVTLDGSASRTGRTSDNVALATNGATVTGTKATRCADLIDGSSTQYTGGTGFAYTYWPGATPGTMTVTLPQEYALTRLRVKLWDGDSRFYRYYVEVATSLAGPWDTVVDRTTGEHRGWCEDTFGPVQAKYIRITGTYNSANSGFHVVELEAHADRPLTYAWTQMSGSPVTLSDASAVEPAFTPTVADDCQFELVVNDGLQDSLPDRVWVSVGMPPRPAADAGPNQNALVGDTVTLDGSGSQAADQTNVALAANGATVTGTNAARWAELIDGNSTQYTGATGYAYTYWRATSPGTMTVTLAQVHPLTRVRVKLWDGDSRYYRYHVEVATSLDGPWDTVVDRTTGEHRDWCEDAFGPVQAKHIRIAGTHNSANSGFHVVELEAYASTPLEYEWTLKSAPQGSQATLHDPSAARPTFEPDEAGDCEFELVVNDGAQNSLPDRVWVSVGMPPRPVADAGPGQAVTVGDTVTLDGSGTRAANETNVALAASGATVTGTNGAYWADLIDGNSTQYTGATGFAYTHWRGSSPGAMTVTLAQEYALNRLRVKLWDGDSRFYRYYVQIATSLGAPWQTVVNRTSGAHQGWCEDTFDPVQAKYIRLIGTYNAANSGFHVVELEAYADRPLTHAWTRVSAPPGSQATLDDRSAVGPSFVPDKAGSYEFELAVNDGVQDSLPDRVRVAATAVVGATHASPPGEAVPRPYGPASDASRGTQGEQGIELLVTPDSGPAPLEVQALVSGAKPGAACKWSFGDGTGGSGDEVTHIYWSPGTYIITVKVHRVVARAAVVVGEPRRD